MSAADHIGHVAPGQIMGLERSCANAFDARLHRHNFRTDDHRGIHLAERHHHQIGKADACPRHHALNVQPRIACEDEEEQNEADESGDADN